MGSMSYEKNQITESELKIIHIFSYLSKYLIF